MARLIVIDPYRTRTAVLADWHITIRPGTDAALALGMMHVILRERREDRAYIVEMTHGFEHLAARMHEYTPERVAGWTGMTAAEVEQLAREYATAKPAVTGAWKYRGGGAQLSTSGGFSWNKQVLERPDLQTVSPLGREARIVNMSALGESLWLRDTGEPQPPISSVPNLRMWGRPLDGADCSGIKTCLQLASRHQRGKGVRGR